MKTIVRVLVVAAILLQGWAAVRATRFNLDTTAGMREYATGKWEAALDRFESARRHGRGDSQNWAWAGDAALSRFDSRYDAGRPAAGDADLLNRAWAGYAGAVIRCPLDAWSWSGLAEVASRRARLHDRKTGLDMTRIERRSQGILDGDYAVALAAARLGAAIKPSGFEQLDSLGSVYKAVGEVDRAEEIFVESARMMPAPAFHSWGTGERLVGPLYQGILQGLREGIRRAPPFERSLLNREIGKFALAQGDTPTALEHLHSAEATALIDYDRFYAFYDLASAQEAAGKLDEAIESLEKARDAGFPRAPVSARIGEIAMRAGKPALACPELRESLRSRPEDDGFRIQAALACEKAGEVDTAEILLRDGFYLPTDNKPLARALVDFYVRAGRPNTAASLVERWAKDDPGDKDLQKWAEQIAAAPR